MAFLFGWRLLDTGEWSRFCYAVVRFGFSGFQRSRVADSAFVKIASGDLMGNRISMRRRWQRSFILIACVRNRMHCWACSSTVEQGTHNPLVLGSNPGGPTKELPNGHAAMRRGRFLFLSNSLPDLRRLGKRHRASFAVIRRHLESYGCICVHLAKLRTLRSGRDAPRIADMASENALCVTIPLKFFCRGCFA